MDKNEQMDAALMEALNNLEEHQKNHFKSTIRLLALCYVKPDTNNGLLLVKSHKDLMMVSVNSDEMEAAELLCEASEYMHMVVTHDAPPREKFN